MLGLDTLATGRMSLYEFSASVVYYGVLSNTNPAPMSGEEFDGVIESLRALDLPDVEV